MSHLSCLFELKYTHEWTGIGPSRAIVSVRRNFRNAEVVVVVVVVIYLRGMY